MLDRIDHYPLSEDSALWGKTVTDQRYALVADEAVAHRSANRGPGWSDKRRQHHL